MSDGWADSPNFWSAYSETYSTGIQSPSTRDVRINSQAIFNMTNNANVAPYLESLAGSIIGVSIIEQHPTSAGQGTIFALYNANDGGTDGAQFFGTMSRGTIASPTATQSGDNLFKFGGQGYNSSNVISSAGGGDSGNFNVFQDAAPTASSAPARVEIGTVSAANWLKFFSSANATTPGLIGIFAATAQLGLEVFRITTAATNDDPAESVYQNRVATTDATATTLQTINIASGYSYHIHAIVVARRTGGVLGTANDTASYERIATVKDVSGTATIVGVVLLEYTAEDQALWDCTIDVTGATARVRVTGAAQNNVTWHSTVKVYPLST